MNNQRKDKLKIALISYITDLKDNRIINTEREFFEICKFKFKYEEDTLGGIYKFPDYVCVINSKNETMVRLEYSPLEIIRNTFYLKNFKKYWDDFEKNK